MAQLVFTAAFRTNGHFVNVSIRALERGGWLQLKPLQYLDGDLQAELNATCNEINALLANDFPLDLLALAGKRSNSNHAEIVRMAAAAVAGQAESLRSFC